MSTHTKHSELNETYFCTLTAYKWLPLFEEAQAYEAVYTWFEHLKKDGCHILAYVIMPNHIHCLLFPTNEKKPLNMLVAKGKRFMAYAIIKKLKARGLTETLKTLKVGVQENEKQKGKIYQVFQLSFDARKCFDEKMEMQKLEYIHHNPVRGKWDLAEDYTKYTHSSASFYEVGVENKYITHYKNV